MYPYLVKGPVGDAAHPMMPDQNQGLSQAVEDAGTVYYLLSPGPKGFFDGTVVGGRVERALGGLRGGEEGTGRGRSGEE